MSSGPTDAPASFLRRPFSLAMRLTFFQALSLALFVAAGSTLLFLTLRRVVEDGIRQQMEEKLSSYKEGVDLLVVDLDGFIDEYILDPGKKAPTEYVRVRAGNGSVLLQTRGMRDLFKEVRWPRPALDVKKIEIREINGSDGRSFRLAALKMESQIRMETLTGAPVRDRYTVEFALDVSREKDLLRRSFGRFLFVNLGGLIFALVAGYSVARLGLNPLKKIAQVTAGIRPRQLHERILSQNLPREITELAEAFNRMLTTLDESFARLERHSAELSHELRTPVHNLMMQNEVILTRPRDSDEYRRTLETNLEELRSLAQTVDSVLFIARMQQGDQALQTEEFSGAEEADRKSVV
jgi:two-component system, OmpR family, heavy metal sensor histidine kinase CusS